MAFNLGNLLKGFAEDEQGAQGGDGLATLLQSLGLGQAQAAPTPAAAPAPAGPGAVPPILQAPAPQPTAEAPVDANDPNQNISVSAPTATAGPRAGSVDSSEPVKGLGNATLVADVAEANKNSEAAGGHHGMFGTKGTLRDILGVLSDGFLVQGGGKAQYQAVRDKERTGDALTGITQNPNAAVERLTQANPDVAVDVQKQLVAQQVAQQARAVAAQAAREKQYSQGITAATSLMGSVKSQKDYDARKPMLQKMNDLYNLGIDIPDKYEDAAGMIDPKIGMTANQQDASAERSRSAQVREGQGQQNADSNTLRASRAPASRATPNPTDASMAAPLLAKVSAGQPLTAGEKEFLTRTGHSEKRGQGKQNALTQLIGSAPAKGGSTSAPTHNFKDGQTVYKGGKAYVVRGGKAYPQ